MLTLAIFPLSAVLWLLACDRLGVVKDEPIINAGNRKGEDE